MKRSVIALIAGLACMVSACTKEQGSVDGVVKGEEVDLNVLARLFSHLPMGVEQVAEVHDAVCSSSDNGYDEEYLMKDLLEAPGRGVGSRHLRSLPVKSYDSPLKDMLASYLRNIHTKSSTCPVCPVQMTPEAFLDILSRSQTQIYWPYSERWDGTTLPIITFDPGNGDDTNIGYRLVGDGDDRRVEEVTVSEELARQTPVWVMNLNEDSSFRTIEVHRQEDPDWGMGGGDIIVTPEGRGQISSFDVSDPHSPELKTLVIQDFTATRNFDSWFAGASEFFLKCGSIEEFTASTEAELQLFNPVITDFMVVVRRDEVGIPKPLKTVLVSDMSSQLVNSAFMLIEDDGGKRTQWECEAIVKIQSKSFGFIVSIPYNSRDDIVWRGSLSTKYFWNRNNVTENFGDVRLTFSIIEENRPL